MHAKKIMLEISAYLIVNLVKNVRLINIRKNWISMKGLMDD